MGIGDILNASRIVLLMHGDTKIDALRALIEDDRVCPEIPCSAVKLHNDVIVVLERALARRAGL